MSKNDDTIEVEGIVKEVLPGSQYNIEITEENFPTKTIRGYLGGKMRKNFIKILPGDCVKVVLSPYDLEKGRVVYRSTAVKK